MRELLFWSDFRLFSSLPPPPGALRAAPAVEKKTHHRRAFGRVKSADFRVCVYFGAESRLFLRVFAALILGRGFVEAFAKMETSEER